ncbi:amino acid ABC transporter ATP-binding protein, PAAT family [Verrucomicrobium sp. GAS474]|uniref:amino acid ABC transporter ATP-binding protein n=1 Tax=Verrucomicrobium sp. GAS474 TaxID=1882831 RepID=UPI00087CF304|nr:amino acid ABC transporter ATP-binding protein [Verrucomicrobium sp. GAS474]SDT90391.1 amino acid ABC transporter ATP-binding protein, PAAT family [Verrucomicrobium sp. GAS474]
MNLELRGLTKTFHGEPVLRDVTLASSARCLALIGPSGGGKSTLLRIIAGLERPSGGEVRWNGTPIPRDEAGLREHRRHLGVVFQASNLFPHLSALENLTLPLEKVHGLTPADARERALGLLARFRLEAHAGKRPAALSGGQRQRVALVRAVAAQPKAILLDEPTSALDPEMTVEVLDMIGELRAEGCDLIVVTHAMGFARQVADEVAFLAEGRIVEAGPAAPFFDAPQSPVCRAFLEKVLKY